MCTEGTGSRTHKGASLWKDACDPEVDEDNSILGITNFPNTRPPPSSRERPQTCRQRSPESIQSSPPPLDERGDNRQKLAHKGNFPSNSVVFYLELNIY